MNKTPACLDCQDERYILHGCCSGYANECGCMGQPVLITNCKLCNPKGDLPMGEYVSDWKGYIEYRYEPTSDNEQVHSYE